MEKRAVVETEKEKEAHAKAKEQPVAKPVSPKMRDVKKDEQNEKLSEPK